MVLVLSGIAIASAKAETKIYLENHTATYVYNKDEPTAIEFVEHLSQSSITELDEDKFGFVIGAFLFNGEIRTVENQVIDILKCNPEGTVVSISFSDGIYVATMIKGHYIAVFIPEEK